MSKLSKISAFKVIQEASLFPKRTVVFRIYKDFAVHQRISYAVKIEGTANLNQMQTPPEKQD